jgi:hypothetical protein
MVQASFKRYDASDLIELNVKSHLDIQFLSNGLYSNISNDQGWYGGSDRVDQLTRVSASVYESNFNNWIYETDVTGPSGYELIHASGIEVDDVFTAWGSGSLAPSIDYKSGRVIFQSDPGSSALVSSAFSYKTVLVSSPESEASKVIFSAFKDNSVESLGLAPSGAMNQLPMVIVDPQNRDLTGRQLGGGSRVTQQIIFHVVGNTRRQANKIVDILSTKSFRKVIQGVDFNTTPSTFDRYGGKLNSYENYTSLQSNNAYKWEKIYIDDIVVKQGPSENLGIYTARVDWEVIFHTPAGG